MRQVIEHARELAKPLLEGVLDVVFPPRCSGCGAGVEAAHSLCGECWKRLRFISEPMCHCCGHPFELAVQPHMLCADCLKESPPYVQCRSALFYDEASRHHIIGYKFHDRTALTPLFAEWLARSCETMLPQIDCIVPVPLHWFRLWRRGYNQAALLAYAVSARTGLPVLPDALLRTRYTTPQNALTRLQRLDNVKGAFHVKSGSEARITGKNILLIDDVITTGATIKASTKALLKAGAERVYVTSVARTVVGDGG